MPGNQKMSKVTAGRDIGQEAAGNAIDQNIEEASAQRDIKQTMGVKPQQSSIRLVGFGSAHGRFAVLVLAAALVLVLAFKYFTSR
jgi:hypothetical protein